MDQSPPSTTATPRQQSIGRRVGIASIYAVLQRMLVRGLGFFSTLILVRLLAPQDFGIAVLASAVLSALAILTTTGFGLAIVRMRAPEKAHYDTAFTLTVLRGLLLGGILCLLAPWQADFMQEPRLEAVTYVIAVSTVLDGLVSGRLVDLQRELRFDVLLRYTVLGKIVAILVSIPLAFWLQNYWALVLGNIAAKIVLIIYSYWIAPYWPRFTLNAWRDLFDFSKWVLGSNLCVMIDQQIMNFVVGRLQGVSAIGLYQVGQQIALLPITELAAPIRMPFYSGFSKIYHDITELRRQFMTGLELQWLILLPMSVGIALIAHEATVIFLGAQWSALIPLIPLIALFGLADSFAANTGNIFLVLNRQARMVISYFILIAIRLGAVFYGTLEAGILGASWAMLITSVINVIAWQWLTNHLLGITAREMLHVLWRGTVAALVMTGAVLLVPDDIGLRLGLPWWPMLVALLAKSLVGAVAYVGSLGLCWWLAGKPDPSAESHVMRWGGEMLERLGFARLRG